MIFASLESTLHCDYKYVKTFQQWFSDHRDTGLWKNKGILAETQNSFVLAQSDGISRKCKFVIRTLNGIQIFLKPRTLLRNHLRVFGLTVMHFLNSPGSQTFGCSATFEKMQPVGTFSATTTEWNVFKENHGIVFGAVSMRFERANNKNNRARVYLARASKCDVHISGRLCS